MRASKQTKLIVVKGWNQPEEKLLEWQVGTSLFTLHENNVFFLIKKRKSTDCVQYVVFITWLYGIIKVVARSIKSHLTVQTGPEQIVRSNAFSGWIALTDLSLLMPLSGKAEDLDIMECLGTGPWTLIREWSYAAVAGGCLISMRYIFLRVKGNHTIAPWAKDLQVLNR